MSCGVASVLPLLVSGVVDEEPGWTLDSSSLACPVVVSGKLLVELLLTGLTVVLVPVDVALFWLDEWGTVAWLLEPVFEVVTVAVVVGTTPVETAGSSMPSPVACPHADKNNKPL
jgi:hypothetical protein